MYFSKLLSLCTEYDLGYMRPQTESRGECPVINVLIYTVLTVSSNFLRRQGFTPYYYRVCNLDNQRTNTVTIFVKQEASSLA